MKDLSEVQEAGTVSKNDLIKEKEEIDKLIEKLEKEKLEKEKIIKELDFNDIVKDTKNVKYYELFEYNKDDKNGNITNDTVLKEVYKKTDIIAVGSKICILEGSCIGFHTNKHDCNYLIGHCVYMCDCRREFEIYRSANNLYAFKKDGFYYCVNGDNMTNYIPHIFLKIEVIHRDKTVNNFNLFNVDILQKIDSHTYRISFKTPHCCPQTGTIIYREYNDLLVSVQEPNFLD
jgi:hypothetical protein